MKETPTDTVSSDEVTQRWLEQLCRRTDDVLWNSYRFALGVADAPLAARHVSLEGPRAAGQ